MPICSTCNRQLYRSDKGRRLDSRLATITSDKKRRPYRKHLKESCVNCGFVPQHTCQLDVDHIDGNHANNNPSNLQTDRKSKRLNPVTNAHLVCRLLLEKKHKQIHDTEVTHRHQLEI